MQNNKKRRTYIPLVAVTGAGVVEVGGASGAGVEVLDILSM